MNTRKKTSVTALLAHLTLSTSLFADYDVTFESLLKEMVDRDALAQWPEHEYKALLHSSYHREAKTPDNATGWFANGDCGFAIREEENQGRKEVVMMEHKGRPSGHLRRCSRRKAPRHRSGHEPSHGSVVTQANISLWQFKTVHYRTKDGKWVARKATNSIAEEVTEQGDGTGFILSASPSPSKGIFLGLSRPRSDINVLVMIGVDEKTGNSVYKDDRTRQETAVLEPKRVPTMSKSGFSAKYSGMLNRSHLESGVHVTYRSEYYILSGTAQEIMATVRLLDALPKLSKEEEDLVKFRTIQTGTPR